MADVQCRCGHMGGEHREILSHHPGLSGQMWCFECECHDFKPMDPERAHLQQEGSDGDD